MLKSEQGGKDRGSSVRRWLLRAVRAVGVLFGIIVVGAVFASCVTRPPRAGSIDGVDRLSALDRSWAVSEPVTISWDEHLIPSINAQNDADAAYAIGLVHAHLRLSQMELFRRVSQGRLSEMAGPLTSGIDAAIRAIDLDRAVPEMQASMAPETLAWIERYVEGINDYRESIPKRPADARTLGFDYEEPWTVSDVLTFGRLASVDVNWGRFIVLAQSKGQLGAGDFVSRLWAFGDEGLPSFGGETRHELNVLTDIGRTGSNAFVVAGGRSASGGALVASDPHLGLPQPNIWCVVGYRTPDRAAVGFTIPGVPFILVGRNESVAWTGTNMQASSTVLYQLPEGWEATGERDEHVSVRWWFDSKSTVRESSFGPVITDADLLGVFGEGDIAMRWRGHDFSDESGAFFGASSASDFEEFRAAFTPYAAGGQNMLYGDKDGNIGQIMAVEAIPAAARASRVGVVDAGDPAFAWGGGVPSTELPHAYNPEAGFIVSANNIPTRTAPPLVPQGNTNDRVARMSALLEVDRTYTLDDLAEIQLDTYSMASVGVAAFISKAAQGAYLEEKAAALVEEIGGWDGRYDSDSTGAYAYQVVLDQLIEALYKDRYAPGIIGTIRSGPYVHDFVLDDLESLTTSETVLGAIDGAAHVWNSGTTWGEMHRLRVAHPIGFVPLLGSPYVFDDLAYAGSTTTIYKAAHAVTSNRHSATFGANSRLLCDMGTLDNNRVVVLGGQDGWLGSDRFGDQVPLWIDGKMIPLPMSVEGQASRAVRVISLGSVPYAE
ncbi:MAG: penicillin acylase family protein [Planctomycetota bacterium]